MEVWKVITVSWLNVRIRKNKVREQVMMYE